MARAALVALFIIAAASTLVSLSRSPAIAKGAVDAAQARARLAPALIERAVQSRRADAEHALLRVLAQPEVAARGPKADAAETLARVRALAFEAVPLPARQTTIVALANDAGVTASRGEAMLAAGDVEWASLRKMGLTSEVRDAFGEPHTFFSAPVPGGHVVIATPVLNAAAVEAALTDAQLVGIAVFRGGAVVRAAGSGATPATAAGVVRSGKVRSVWPWSLPAMTSGDAFGGEAPLEVAARGGLSVGGLDVVAVASAHAAMSALADQQASALYGLLFTLVACGAGLILLWPRPVRAPRPQPEEGEAPSEAATAAEAVSAAGDSAPEAPAAPAPRPSSAPSPAAAAAAAEGDTALAAIEALGSDAPFASSNDFQLTEATRPRASIPVPDYAQALLGAAEADASAAADSDESHYREVFEAFLQTRAKCGEAADGLNFEKFALKLRKNREQLIGKYHCRTVRFTVHVKEGKAALKATPVRD